MVPLVTGPIPVFILYDGTKKVKGLLKRVKKRFPDGLIREAKDFYLEKAREGKHPRVLAADLSPVFGRGSKYQGTHSQEAEPAPQPVPEPEPVMDTLFDMSPDQLPD